jgi:hypothetical protein
MFYKSKECLDQLKNYQLFKEDYIMELGTETLRMSWIVNSFVPFGFAWL